MNLPLNILRVVSVLLGLLFVISDTVAAVPAGIEFQCDPSQLNTLETRVGSYLRSLGVASEWFQLFRDDANGQLRYTLNTEESDTDTVHLYEKIQYQLADETLHLPNGRGYREVQAPSRREIVLALMQHGRLTRYTGLACTVDALMQEVELRQNIAAWAMILEWQWPNGGPARWNRRFWRKGTPHRTVRLHEALNDAFIHQDKYAIGCYTATKMVFSQGILDYFHRVRPDPVKEALVLQRLYSDGDPLVDIEAESMWYFESDYDASTPKLPGKLLKVMMPVAPNNFVPGDWSYLVNNDRKSFKKTGYEGSNMIYLGRNRFDDYYNDNDHYYTYGEKMNEVYNWRNGVFSRSRDYLKIESLTPEAFQKLQKTIEEGGLILASRSVPYLFGYEALPPR
jgi:hypothetical protein